jgi:hypothetical protein
VHGWRKAARDTDLIISGGSCAHERVTLPLYPEASFERAGCSSAFITAVSVAVVVDDIEVAESGVGLDGSVTGERKVTDLCHVQIQPTPKHIPRIYHVR